MITKVEKAKTKDIAIQYRMAAGFPGDVSRTHPVDILPRVADSTNPPTLAGQGVIYDTTSGNVRPLSAGDGSITSLLGVTVRTFPFQQATTSANFGATPIGGSALPVSGSVDILERGFVIVQVPQGQTPSTAAAGGLGGVVYIWIAASTGSHVQGGFEAVASSGNTATISNAHFVSGADSNGYVEMSFNI